MARLPITIYRNSILASIISIVGTICLVAGICLVFEEMEKAIEKGWDYRYDAFV